MVVPKVVRCVHARKNAGWKPVMLANSVKCRLETGYVGQQCVVWTVKPAAHLSWNDCESDKCVEDFLLHEMSKEFCKILSRQKENCVKRKKCVEIILFQFSRSHHFLRNLRKTRQVCSRLFRGVFHQCEILHAASDMRYVIMSNYIKTRIFKNRNM